MAARAPEIDPPALPMPAGPLAAVPVLFLWPYAQCNCRCAMCDIWMLRAEETPRVTPADVRAWVPEWTQLGVRSVVLTGGEALMHPEIREICATIKEAGFTVSLLSTGITLARRADIVTETCDGLFVSLDGPAEVHNRIRGVKAAFDKLAAGVAEVKRLRPELPIRAKCTVQSSNCGLLRETVETARAMGVDALGFSATDTFSAAYNRPKGWSLPQLDRVTISVEDLRVLERELELLFVEHAADFTSGFIADTPADLQRRLLDYNKAGLGMASYPKTACNAPWTSAVVEYDGSVRPCFFQPAYGNIHQSGGLAATLNSPEAQSFRRRLDVTTDETCRKCVCTLAVHPCDCGWSRAGPYCDDSCSLVAFYLT
jgi:MoaA/NifB/PqqE/SkfB family radical SAM enzyme